MVSTLAVQLNGQARTLEDQCDPSSLQAVIGALDLKSDRVAVELNGEIVRRSAWTETLVRGGDRLEIVHFVGGGSPQAKPATGNSWLQARKVRQGGSPVAVISKLKTQNSKLN